MKENNAMTIEDKLLHLVKSRGGFVTARLLSEKGISHPWASHLVNRGRLVRVERGMYTLPETPSDIFYSTQCRFRRGIFSHASALFLHKMTDRTPYILELTFPAGYHAGYARASGHRCYRVRKELYESSVVDALTPCGNIVRAYSPERTICDIFKVTRGAPTDEEINALKMYLRMPSRNVNHLFSIATELKVDELIRPYLEALL